MTRIHYTLLTVIVILGLGADAWCQTAVSKMTPAARVRANSLTAGETGKFWLFLEDDAFDSSKVFLTEKARTRRAKVDPANFLIGPGDYPIKDEILQSINDSGLKVRHVSKWLQAVSVEAGSGALAKAGTLPAIKRVDILRTLTGIRDEEVAPVKFGQIAPKSTALDYGLSLLQNTLVKAVKLHEAGLEGEGVMIAVFDSGFETDLPVFDSINIADTYDFINGDVAVDELECPLDDYRRHQAYHGTAVLSMMGGYAPDTLIGIAPAADYLLAKTEITCGGVEIQSEEDNWIAAAEWADSLGADIINSSLGYVWFTDEEGYTFEDLNGDSALITIAADAAAARNIAVFNSAGNERNDSWNHIVFPADGDSVMAVGAIRSDSTLASFSSPGPTFDGRIKPDIVSLGVGVVAASHLGGYNQVGGTSYSSPLTAAGAALALQHDPAMTADELRNLIRQTGDRAAHPDNDFGYGLFDATAAADIIKFDPPYGFEVNVNRVTNFTVTTSGRTDSIPDLAILYSPPGVSLIDAGDGSGLVEVLMTSDDPRFIDVTLTADVSYFVDTTSFRISRAGGDAVVVGPNPFADQVNIYIDSSAGDVLSLSVFNTSGEIVWEKVNNFIITADEISDLWDGRNQDGEIVAAGVYILVVNTNRQTYRVKMLKTN